MKISIQFKPTKRLDLDFGYDTPLFSQMHWINIVLVSLDKANGYTYEVVFASIRFSLFKHYKYWFK